MGRERVFGECVKHDGCGALDLRDPRFAPTGKVFATRGLPLHIEWVLRGLERNTWRGWREWNFKTRIDTAFGVVADA